MEKTCIQCGETYKTSNKRQKYCDQKCYSDTKGGKIETICKNCGKTFTVYNKNIKKFCSSKCYSDSRIGSKRPKHGKKLSQTMIDKHAIYKGTPRAKNIGIANTKVLSIKEINNLISILNLYPLMTATALIAIYSGISERVLRRVLKDKKIQKAYGNRILYLPQQIQKWELSKVNNFLKDVEEGYWIQVLKKYDIYYKTFTRLIDHYQKIKVIHKPYYGNNQSKPEKLVESILKNNSFSYKREQPVSRWRADFIVNENIVIEVQGDYWHANPKVYDRSNLNSLTKVQKKGIIRDKKKKDWILSNDFDYIEVWENDLKYDFDNTLKKLIQELRRIENDRGKETDNGRETKNP